MPPRFLEGRLHLPAQDEPPHDLLGAGTKVSAQQGLGSELSFRIAHQHPAYGYGGQSRAVPECSRRSYLHAALPTTIPVVHGGGGPGGGRILGYDRKIRETFALQARSSYLPGSAGWRRIVERCVQPQASNERHRPGQEAPAACEKSEASNRAIAQSATATISRWGHQRLTRS